jgi:sugar lactone lactonase YvrE
MKTSRFGFASKRAASLLPLVLAMAAAGCGGSSDWCVEWDPTGHGPGKWDHPAKPDHPPPPPADPGPPQATGLALIAGDQCSQCGGSADGTGSNARFNGAEGVAADGSGNLYVAERVGAAVRKVTTQGVATTLAGSFGQEGSADGVGGAARFRNPTRLAADSAGNVYVTDTGNSTIRKISPAGSVTTLAGQVGACGTTDGGGTLAQFCNPQGIALDQAGNLFIADTRNHTIRKIDPSGLVTTVAGHAGTCGSADGAAANAMFCEPRDITVDRWNNVYVADTGNSTIRMIDPKGQVTTLAGAPGVCSSADGAGSAARFCSASGITVDSMDNLYVADTGNSTIRRIDVNNVVSTVAGVAQQHGVVLGPLPGGLDAPIGITMESDASVALTSRNLVLRLVPPK